MKRLGLLFLISMLCFVYGCGKPENFGKEITLTKITKIRDIHSSPGNYNNKVVRIEGKIVQECPTGCWFDMRDETGQIYVGLSTAGLAIPQKVGSKVIVQGKVIGEGRTKVEIAGQGIQID